MQYKRQFVEIVLRMNQRYKKNESMKTINDLAHVIVVTLGEVFR